MFRKIFIIEIYTEDGDLVMRRLAANRKTADKIARPYGEDAIIRETSKSEWMWINFSEVERM